MRISPSCASVAGFQPLGSSCDRAATARPAWMDRCARTAADSCSQMSKLAMMKPEDRGQRFQIKTAGYGRAAFIGNM